MDLNGEWNLACGTSFSAPSVVGAAALIWSANPNWSAAQVRERLISSALDLGPTGYDEKFGHGRISAFQAFVMSSPPFQVSVLGPATVGPNTYACSSWSAQVQGAQLPVEYSWSGLFTGSEASVSGTVPQNGGTLEVLVTDSRNVHGIGLR